MIKPDYDLLMRLEGLVLTAGRLAKNAEGSVDTINAAHALSMAVRLGEAVLDRVPVFGFEPWHSMDADADIHPPGEFLLRLKDEKGEAIPPYPGIMSFYQSGLTAELDTVLVLCALKQFRSQGEKEISINISGHSLKDHNFIKTTLRAIEHLKLAADERVIFEIHESTANAMLNPKLLRLFRSFGAGFAIDDVGLSMKDVMRLAAFENIADYIKIDRQSVCAHPQDPQSLDQVMSFVRSLLPGAAVVAEGIKTHGHAIDVKLRHPDIAFAQGLYLPDRDTFKRDFAAAANAAGLKNARETLIFPLQAEHKKAYV